MQTPDKKARPTDVTILAAIAILGGVFGLIGGTIKIGCDPRIGCAIGAGVGEPETLGVVVIVFAVLGLALGVGFIGGRRWAWTLGVPVYIVSLPIGAWEMTGGGTGSTGGFIRIVLGLVMLFYLTRPHVRAFFRTTRDTAGISSGT